VYQGTAAGAENPVPVTTVTGARSVTLNGLANGTRYYFTVAAFNNGGTGPMSNEDSATPAPPPPAAPKGLVATSGDGKAVLSWSASAGAASYAVFQGSASGEESDTPVKASITATQTTITGLTNGEVYYFVVKARNGGGFSAPSNERPAHPQPPPPPAPKGLTATAGDGKANLSWSAADRAVTYSVLQGPAPGSESAAPVKSGITGTTTTISGLVNGTTYYFVVEAKNGGGISPLSNERAVTPQPPRPAAPKNLALANGDGQVTLNWTAADRAASYSVFVGSAAHAESDTPVQSGITGTSTVVSGLVNGTTYYFVVKAVNGGGTSAASNERAGRPHP
ncbi:MAG TPA: fibronectin type III domain-containing protein, partial [Nevskiaceae bacterium]|nr:fibronectin type III domain-containing protein [Nevskiaceae bacterium]